jgi:hypothetical protein
MGTDVEDRFPPLLLTEGGPGDALMRRLKLAPLGLRARRAAVVLALVAWAPLLVLSVIQGLAIGGVTIPFLYDLAAHVRFLVAVPVLLLAEIPIGARLRQTSAQFIVAGLVRPDDESRFADAIRDTTRLRDARVPELIVLALAYVTTFGMIMRSSFQQGSTWYTPADGRLMPAGWWYAFVSVPIFQFLLYRWIYRMFLWGRFLRRVAALDLQLSPAHPDGAGGLGFLGKGCVPFGLVLFATSAVVSSSIATHVLFAGGRLEDFQLSYAALFVLALLVFTIPLLAFTPTLFQLKRQGTLEYGAFASRYTRLFDRKWVKGLDATDESPLGTGDIQSLADLGNSYENLKKLRPVPIQVADFVAMAIPGVIPALPLAFIVMPVSDILKGLLHLLA